MAVKIITDSTSYLTEAVKKAYDIRVITLSVVFEDEVIEELNISNEAFYQKMASVNYFPTSSQPSIEAMRKMFEAVVSAGDDLVAVFISSEMSGTYQSAVMVKNQLLEDYPKANIEIVDSRANCMELGFQAINAAKVAQAGGTFEEVVEATHYTLKRSRFVFTPETLDYLRKGGRIGMAKAMLGNVLKLKPILTVADGHTSPVTSVRTRNKSLDKLIQLFDEDVKAFGLSDFVIHHINCEDSAKELADKLQQKTGLVADIVSIGPVVGVHVGPGAMGIVYVTEEERKAHGVLNIDIDQVKESIGNMKHNIEDKVKETLGKKKQ